MRTKEVKVAIRDELREVVVLCKLFELALQFFFVSCHAQSIVAKKSPLVVLAYSA